MGFSPAFMTGIPAFYTLSVQSYVNLQKACFALVTFCFLFVAQRHKHAKTVCKYPFKQDYR